MSYNYKLHLVSDRRKCEFGIFQLGMKGGENGVYGRAARHIVRLRKDKGLTQTDVADLRGTSQDYISKLETGRLQIKADDYLDLVEMLQGVEHVASFIWNGREAVR